MTWHKNTQKNTDLDFNEQFQRAYEMMEEETLPIFLTGKAGTGKSTLLKYFQNHTKKKTALLAPTGVAALHIKGQTIHSFFKFKPNVTLESVENLNLSDQRNLYKKLDTIVIDEISMVRPDLLDCIDKFLRLNGSNPEKKFGGVQMIFIGDLYQLPPVVTRQEKTTFYAQYPSPYFFAANCMEKFDFQIIELETIYRQKDSVFIDLLNSIRVNAISEKGIAMLNERSGDFEATQNSELCLHLTTTNQQSDTINESCLKALPSQSYLFRADIAGEFKSDSFPAPYDLEIKNNSQIMMLNNDPLKRWSNGTIGQITHIEQTDNTHDYVIYVQLENNKNVKIERNTWEIYHTSLENDQIKIKTVGSFTQFPLTLAWAVTIHKSQGKTFKKVVIDFEKGVFCPGQAYVALSRCQSLEGLILKTPLEKKHLLTDTRVAQFFTEYFYRQSAEKFPLSERKTLLQDSIDHGKDLEIVYLTKKNQKSQRTLRPEKICLIPPLARKILGLEAYCYQLKGKRLFHIEHMLEIAQVDRQALSQ
jgi:ATP-dependent DNA helicase PIF1